MLWSSDSLKSYLYRGQSFVEGYFDIYRTGTNNRPFYRYRSHIELIGFKEYNGMPGGMRTIQYTCISIYVRFSGQFFLKFS